MELLFKKSTRKGQDVWTYEDVAHVLSELNKKIVRMDYDVLIEGIAEDLEKKISSTKMVISMAKYVQSNGEVGVYNVTKALTSATNDFIEENGTKLFTHRL